MEPPLLILEQRELPLGVAAFAELSLQAFLAVVTSQGNSDLHKLAGRALEAADAAKSPALDNRTAIGRSVTAVLTAAHDALREAKELAQQPQQPAAVAEASLPEADAYFEPDACSEQARCDSLQAEGHTSICLLERTRDRQLCISPSTVWNAIQPVLHV